MANKPRDIEKPSIGTCVCPICEETAPVYGARRRNGAVLLYWHCACGSIQPIKPAGQRFFTLPRACFVRHDAPAAHKDQIPLELLPATVRKPSPEPVSSPEPVAIDNPAARFISALANQLNRNNRQ